MTRPIPDQAEVAVEYPDGLYIGTFTHTPRCEAYLNENGLSLGLDRPGPHIDRIRSGPPALTPINRPATTTA
jgi:hypothetical protein